MPLQIGQVLSKKYRIERMLGEGGFGFVYQATELQLNRSVAIKELRSELANNPEVLNRFKREAIAVAQLQNPSIVTLFTFDTESNRHYMILEFMDGGSLANLLKERARLSPGEAAKIARAVCDGLAATHRLDIVHRDIKPANILLTRDGNGVKLSDFGIAHVPSAVSGQGSLTHIGTTMGTPWYMSPEQARGERVDARSDLYAVGAVLYEMIAGYTYLEFTSDFLRDVERLKTTPPRALAGSVPQGLQQIIWKALAKDPARRFQSAEQMAAALQAFSTPGATIAVPRPGREQMRDRVPSPAQPQSSLPWILGGAGIGTLLLCILVLAFALLRPTSSSSLVLNTQVSSVQVTLPTPSAALSAPTIDLRTAVFQTFVAQAQATQAVDTQVAMRVASTQTASAPTATRTLLPTATPTLTATPPPASPTPLPSPTRGLVGIQLVDPPDKRVFKDEDSWIYLEWKPNPPSFVILADNEYYRVQVSAGAVICNFYTKETAWTLPPSGQSGGGACDPNKWRYNSMMLTEWRVSLVVKRDDDRNHDIEKSNSVGRSFGWHK